MLLRCHLKWGLIHHRGMNMHGNSQSPCCNDFKLNARNGQMRLVCTALNPSVSWAATQNLFLPVRIDLEHFSRFLVSFQHLMQTHKHTLWKTLYMSSVNPTISRSRNGSLSATKLLLGFMLLSYFRSPKLPRFSTNRHETFHIYYWQYSASTVADLYLILIFVKIYR